MAEAEAAGGDMAEGDVVAGEGTGDSLAEGEVDLMILTEGTAGSAWAWRRVVLSGKVACAC